MPTVDWPHELIEQLGWHWREQFRPRLDGLTDDEYAWEPVPDCWSAARRCVRDVEQRPGCPRRGRVREAVRAG